MGWFDDIFGWIEEHPYETAGIALGIGIAIGAGIANGQKKPTILRLELKMPEHM